MKNFISTASTLFVLLLIQAPVRAQVPDTEQWPVETVQPDGPLDDIVEKKTIAERRALPYAPIREGDVLWQQYVWRVIDAREKQNLSFLYPEDPFFNILADAAKNGTLRAYSTEDDKFRHPMSPGQVSSKLSRTDTILTLDPITFKEHIAVVQNDINWADVKRFRVKECWFFDQVTSSMKVRILGIAPLLDVKDENGNFRYEAPLFWIYYPEARNVLASHRVFTPGANQNTAITWEDVLEMRHFSSTVTKGSNIYDRAIKDYTAGIDGLVESGRISSTIFNYEHDMWQY